MLSYGAELELANVDTRLLLPKGNTWDTRDYTIYNDGLGMWNDPMKILHPYGGEINTKVSYSVEDAVENIKDIFSVVGENFANFSTNLHIHIGIPDWDDTTVKTLISYIKKYQSELYDATPIPLDCKYKRRRTSNNHKIPKYIRDRIVNADEVTPELFGNTRFGINVKSLYTRGTVEFRQFAMTENIYEIQVAFNWCRAVIQNALYDLGLPEASAMNVFPKFQEAYEVSTDTHFGRHSRAWIHRRHKTKIAFICYGNVNRSRVAEAVFKKLDVENLFDVTSFGIRYGTYNKPVHAQTAKLLREHGYDVPQDGSKRLPGHTQYTVIDVRDWAVDPGYTKDKHYEAFKLIEAKTQILYKEIMNEKL